MTDIKFSINKKFAEAYEKKKRHEELALLEEKYKDGAESDTDSDDNIQEDEDGELLTPEIGADILKTISKIRAKDDSVYDPNAKFYDEKNFAAAFSLSEKRREAAISAEKPVYLKDYHRERLLGERRDEETSVTHVVEQKELKQDLKRAFSAIDSDEEDFLVQKTKTKEDLVREEEDYKEFLLENLAQDETSQKNMSDWFCKDDRQIDKDEKFLMDYILTRGWIDKNQGNNEFDEQILQEIEDDEKNLDAAEELEAQYNFRYEHPNATQVVTHSRAYEDSYRRINDSRKLKRQNAIERKAEERKKKDEELKRLKNLKRQEIKDRLKQIREVSGSKIKVKHLDLETEFDPKSHDRIMEKVFDDKFYKESVDNEKPQFEDDLDYIDKKYGIASSSSTKEDQAIQNHLEEYYQLDYEDLVGDLPTRFKYRSVPASDFGLTTKEILKSDDKALNEFVSLKKLAPYRPIDKQKRDIEKLSKAHRVKEFKKKYSNAWKEKTSKTE